MPLQRYARRATSSLQRPSSLHVVHPQGSGANSYIHPLWSLRLQRPRKYTPRHPSNYTFIPNPHNHHPAVPGRSGIRGFGLLFRTQATHRARLVHGIELENTKGTKQYEKLRHEDRDVYTNDGKRVEAGNARRVSDLRTSQIVSVQIIDKRFVSLRGYC